MNQTFILPRLLSRERAIERIAKVLASLSPEKAWRIEIGLHKERRTQQQNRYLFGVVYRTILDAGALQGWETEDLHEYMLGKWGGWERVEGFGKVRLRPVRRSSTLNKAEFADYIDFIQRRMAEHGVFIPDADKELAA
jgi:hypothetical protein